MEEAFQLASKKATYFTSGLVVALYPDEESDIGKQYVVLKNNFVEDHLRKSYIIQKNAYVDEAGKYFTELVNGPQLQANTVYGRIFCFKEKMVTTAIPERVYAPFAN